MDIFKMMRQISKNMVLSHAKETEKIVRMLAVSIYWDEEVTDEELDEAYKLLRVHFENLNVSDDEIEVIKGELDGVIRSFKIEKLTFIKEKKVLLDSLVELKDEEKQYCFELIRKVLRSDGLNEKEQRFIDKIND